MSVEDEPVEDGVGVGGLVYGAMPGFERELDGDDGGHATVSALRAISGIAARSSPARRRCPMP
jgi:hypothetical protein